MVRSFEGALGPFWGHIRPVAVNACRPPGGPEPGFHGL